MSWWEKTTMRISSIGPLAVAATIFATFGCNGSPNGPNGTNKKSSSTAPGSTQQPPAPNPNPKPKPNPTPGGTGFSTSATLQAPRGLHTATLLSDGRVLVAGGIDAQKAGPGFVIESEIFDPTASTFTKVSDKSLGGNPGGYMLIADPKGNPFPVPRAFHTATRLNDGRVLLAGGYGMETFDAQGKPQQTDLTSAFIFDPKTNHFSFAGQLNAPRSNHMAVPLPNGQVLFAGGFDGSQNNGQGGTVQTAELFDPTQAGQQGAFTALTTGLQVPRQSAGAAATPSGPIFVGGEAIFMPQGATAPQQGLAPGSEIFANNAFATGPAPATDRAMAAFSVTANGFVLAGGMGAKGMVTDVELLDTGVTAFSKVCTLSSGRVHASAAATDLGVLLVGGVTIDAQGNVSGTLDTGEFIYVSSATTASSKMAQPRNSSAATTLANGSILVTGGFTGGTKDVFGLDGTSIPVAEIYTNGSSGNPTPSPSPNPNPNPNPKPNPAPATLSFAKDILPIIQANCTQCHPNAAKGIDLTVYSTITGYVTPKDPTNSTLMAVLDTTNPNYPTYQGTSQDMSGNLDPTNPTQNAADLQTISDWITQGANP